MLRLDTDALKDYVQPHELDSLQPFVITAHKLLHNKNGPGHEFLGWLDWPETHDHKEVANIKEIAREIKNSQAFIVIGIGGSYLGAKASLEMLCHSFYNHIPGNTQIFFAGQNISSSYLHDLLEVIKDKDVYINVISKSGTTTEPALAFRILKELFKGRYSKEEMQSRIIVTTDPHKGALRQMAIENGYRAFAIPRDIGGRYSVLTPVGMLPMAVAGIDIDRVLAGAGQAYRELKDPSLNNNPSYKYAALRDILYRKGKTLELLVTYEPGLQIFAEWWKQLFGESNGKDHKGLFPAAAVYTTDLHSLGQYVQDGLRNLFETVIHFRETSVGMTIPYDHKDSDSLNYLTNKTLHHVNQQAFKGTLQAHIDGGVPSIVIEAEKISPETFGYMVYFFQKACAISGYLMGVNPFDQPGVEDYKINMFTLLGKS